jgi:1-acyl-sn-glycerol-3-phosphate acyltransferase
MMLIARVIAVVWLPTVHRFRSRGVANVPIQGAVILAPNHTSYLDPILVTYPIRRRLYYLAWHQLFANRLFGWVIRSLGAISIDTDKRSDRAAYESALSQLRAGRAVAIFPEGVRGWDGSLHPLQPGVARLAVASGAPIVPVIVRGAFECWPRWQLLPRLFVPLSVEFLPPLRPAVVDGAGDRRREAERLLRELEDALRSAMNRPLPD